MAPALPQAADNRWAPALPQAADNRWAPALPQAADNRWAPALPQAADIPPPAGLSMSGGALDLEALRQRLDAGLSRRPRMALDRSDLVSAAVLVPITDHGEPHLLFTKKTGSVPHHKGQFSFPGGIVETRDGSRVETALREAWEEIRLPAEAVEVLGLLDDTETRATNFIITPVVGIVRDHVEFKPDGREIERVLEVPLRTLRDPAIFRTQTWERNGEPHAVLFYQVSPDDVIWGATARILSQFLSLLDEAAERM